MNVVADFIESQGYVNEYSMHDAIVRAFDGYDVTSYEFQQVRERAPFKRAIQRLKTEGKLLVTTRRKEKVVLALDGQVIDQAMEEIQKTDEERAQKARETAAGDEASQGAPEAPEAVSAPSRQKEDLREREVMALFRQRVSSMLVRAVKARVSDVAEDAFFTLLCRFVDEHCTLPLHAADAMAHDLGLALRDVAWNGNPLSQSIVGAHASKVTVGPAALRLRLEGKHELAARLVASAMALHLDEPQDMHQLDTAYGGKGSGFEAWTGSARAEVWAKCEGEMGELEAAAKEHWSKTPKSVACHGCAQGAKSFCISPDGRVMRKTYHFARTRAHAHILAGTQDPDAGTGSPLPGWNDTGNASRRARAEDATDEDGEDAEVLEE